MAKRFKLENFWVVWRWVKVDEKEWEWTAALVFLLYIGNVSDRKSKIFEIFSNKYSVRCGV